MTDIDKAMGYLATRGAVISPTVATYEGLTMPRLKEVIESTIPGIKVPRKKADRVALMVAHTHRRSFTAGQRRRLKTLTPLWVK